MILIFLIALLQKELHFMERDMYQAKRARDAQLNETKKEVERRREPVVERVDKRVSTIW